jgi:flagellar biosynthesis/type III secretory pathway protein FliH
MSVIKAGTVLVSGERRSTLQAAAAGEAPAVFVDTQALRIAELEKALADANARLAALAKSADAREKQAQERGHAEGMESGKTQAQQRHDEQLEALAQGIADAQESFQRELIETAQQWSVDLAQAALGRVIGDTALYAELIARTVAHHLRSLAHDSVLAIEVASVDFPDDAALRAAFAEQGAMPSYQLSAQTGRAAGSCVIKLKLGRLDLSLPSQRQRLDAAFDSAQGRD